MSVQVLSSVVLVLKKCCSPTGKDSLLVLCACHVAKEFAVMRMKSKGRASSLMRKESHQDLDFVLCVRERQLTPCSTSTESPLWDFLEF